MSASTRSDDLLPHVAHGDANAMQAIMERYGALVYSIARRVLGAGGRCELEDAVQEAFIAIWMNAQRFESCKGAESAFVAVIAQRRLIDHRRRFLSRQDVASLDDASIFADARPQSHKADRATDEISRTMSRLRPKQRLVLELSLGRGCSSRQIARALRWPVGTVKSHARRGLLHARRIMGVGPGELVAPSMAHCS